MKPLRLTAHAAFAAAERGIERAWIEGAVREPDWTAPDARDSAVERRFRGIVERDGRVLRVACVETATEIVVVTVFFDRGARKPS